MSEGTLYLCLMKENPRAEQELLTGRVFLVGWFCVFDYFCCYYIKYSSSHRII